jgi:DNA-binding GntR family transcriptional regulator
MDGNLIRQWSASPYVRDQIAADFARKIDNGQITPWHELPGNDETADDYGVNARTVLRAKKLLAEETDGKIRKVGGVYVVTQAPAQTSDSTSETETPS